MAVKSLDPKKVIIIIGGIQVSGFVDGTFLNIGRINPMFTNGSGADGEGWRSKSNDKTGIATLSLLQTSKSNAELSALALLDEETGNGVVPMLVKDLSGTSLYSAETVWIEKVPDSGFSREVEGREWVIKTDDLKVFVGGN